MLEIALLLLITVLNIRGVHVAGRAEFILSNLKILPLVILPLVGIFAFQDQHIVCSVSDTLPTKDIIVQVIILTFWGFIGLECATTPAGSIDNPTKTIPKAVVTGTLFVALLYMLNSAGIMGIMPAQTLAQSQAPYADAAHLLFGKGWNLVISLLAFIVCVGTLNAWMLTSGQIALGASEDGLFPKALGRTNRTQSPQTALIISALGIIPLLILTTDHSLAQSIHHIINISVTAFLFVYGMCVLSFLLISYQESPNHAFKHVLLGGLALLFCLGLVFTTEPKMLLYSSFFTLSGIPAYLWMRKKSSV
jgi:APA family basic amino acid/polyamine antiporter